MAVAFIHEVPGLTQEQYEMVVREAKQAGPAPGGLLHLAGPMDGGWRIIDVWESREAAEALYTDAWRRRVEEIYGVAPVVRYFEVPVLIENAVAGAKV